MIDSTDMMFLLDRRNPRFLPSKVSYFQQKNRNPRKKTHIFSFGLKVAMDCNTIVENVSTATGAGAQTGSMFSSKQPWLIRNSSPFTLHRHCLHQFSFFNTSKLLVLPIHRNVQQYLQFSTVLYPCLIWRSCNSIKKSETYTCYWG